MFSSIDTMWVLIGAALVFFMQAGFAMVETGFTRAKNAGNIIMKNLMDYCLGTPVFWIVGFGLMFAGDGPFVGGFDFFIQGDYSSTYPTSAFIIFQTVFCATAATIVSGAMAERTKFSAYCIYSAIISAVVYPISGHWIWGGGWLSALGFHDFAGSTAVHMVGGVAALVGAKILGPRADKYDAQGNPKAIPGHSLTLGALGCFILWFCWFGFNGCSTVAMEGDAAATAADIFLTTNLSAACASCATMAYTWIRYKKPDVSMTLNGSLAGLVAITAGCDVVSPGSAAIIGIISGVLVVISVEFFEKKARIDDPVGAISVHGVCGATGTILTGVFAKDKGLLCGGGFQFLGTQILGVLTVALYVGVVMFVVFTVIRKTVGLRVSPQEELVGLDVMEHGLTSAYADFVPMVKGVDAEVVEAAPPVRAKVAEGPVPATIEPSRKSKMSKVVIISNPEKFEPLKEALNEIEITGLTVTKVWGCGMQKGSKQYYRGVPIEMSLNPKIKMEIVVSKVPVQLVVDTARRILYSGDFGDGKVFVYDVEDVVKIRTGETGYDALQDEDDV